MNPLRALLFPISLIYDAATRLRNKWFDSGRIKSTTFDLPTIVVGNLSTGGTGKTPHTEYLVNLLSAAFNIAVLSRGYGRETKGYILSNKNSTPEEIGDEPKQIKSKFPKTPVAVCEKRVDGIHQLIKDHKNLDCIVLDDAFQHRYVTPGLNILITSYWEPFYNDYVLPTGNLREKRSGAKRADITIVSKCPSSLDKEEIRHIEQSIQQYTNSSIYFSKFKYGNWISPISDQSTETTVTQDEVVLVTGIANPNPLLDHLKEQKVTIHEHLKYRDHYSFTAKDFETMISKAKRYPNAIILMTEKDMVRIPQEKLEEMSKISSVFYVPIEVEFLEGKGKAFDTEIKNFVS